LKIIGFIRKCWLVSVTLSICLLLTVSCRTPPATIPEANGEELTTYQLEINLLGTGHEATVDSQGKVKTSAQATSADGTVGLSIDKDTIILDEDGKPIQLIQATIDPNPPPLPEDATKVGPVYDLTPNGATFNPPIKLTLTYEPKELPEGLSENDVYIACYEDGKWEMLRYKQVDTGSHRIATQLDHFAKYGVFIPSSESPPTPDSDHTSLPTNRVEVVYFHRTNRCQKCLYAEEQTRYTLETYFKEELSSGKLTFASINLQDASNAAIVEKYGAYASQLFINTVTGDTERIEHVTEIWQLIGNDEAFYLVVKNKVMQALEGIQ
jgi:hypothetical protein